MGFCGIDLRTSSQETAQDINNKNKFEYCTIKIAVASYQGQMSKVIGKHDRSNTNKKYMYFDSIIKLFFGVQLTINEDLFR